MRLADRLRLPLSFDPARLARDLDALASADWTQHYVPQNYDGDWSVLPLRASAGETHPIRMINPDPSARAWTDTAMLSASPYFREVLAAFACEKRTVRLMRLRPGSVIKPHTDVGLDDEHGDARVHVPIVTNDDVEFLLNGRRVVMAPGEAWRLRLADPHSVANRGATDRVHLVIDLTINDWLRAMLREASTEDGAGGRDRTDTLSPEPDFESGASTSSATPATVDAG
jgi:hypothetical protein